MSAQDELPPGCEVGEVDDRARDKAEAHGARWWAMLGHGTMSRVTRGEVVAAAWVQWERNAGITREEYTTMRAAAERCAELEAALAKVTAERDEARRIAGQHRDAHESDTERRGGAPMRVRHPWERATLTEGEKAK